MVIAHGHSGPVWLGYLKPRPSEPCVCSVGMSYQRSWNDQRDTYQSSSQRYQGSGFKPSYSGYRQGLGSARTSDAVGNCVRNRERQERQAARRMGLAVVEKSQRRERKEGSPRGTRRPLIPNLPPAALNCLRARKEGRRNGRGKRRKKPRKTRTQENAAGRGPSHLKMTRKRERCVQHTKPVAIEGAPRIATSNAVRDRRATTNYTEKETIAGSAVRESGAQRGTAGNGAREARGRSADHPGGAFQR